MKNNNLKTRIKNGQLTIGSWITLGNTSIAEILANAGFDWLVVDMEHTTISISDAGELIRVIELSGVPSLVRLTNNDENLIKRVLDAGAHGIIVPMVNNSNEAKKAVEACRYPPLGTRGVGLSRAQEYGVSFKEHLSWQSDIDTGPIVIVQIEHIDAIDNLKEILSVPGVDAFIVGPYDLSCSMQLPGQFKHAEFKKIMKKIINISNDVNSTSGFHVVEPNIESLEDTIELGYKFIAYSADIRMLDVSARAVASKITNMQRKSTII